MSTDCYLKGFLVDLVGIEPTTSSMPFLNANSDGATLTKRERHREAEFTRTYRSDAVSRFTPRDTLRHRPTMAGTARLRNKTRHKARFQEKGTTSDSETPRQSHPPPRRIHVHRAGAEPEKILGDCCYASSQPINSVRRPSP